VTCNEKKLLTFSTYSLVHSLLAPGGGKNRAGKEKKRRVAASQFGDTTIQRNKRRHVLALEGNLDWGEVVKATEYPKKSKDVSKRRNVGKKGGVHGFWYKTLSPPFYCSTEQKDREEVEMRGRNGRDSVIERGLVDIESKVFLKTGRPRVWVCWSSSFERMVQLG